MIIKGDYMREIFKAKRNLHRFINMAFYLLFFIAGFLVGGGNFEKVSTIISKFIN